MSTNDSRVLALAERLWDSADAFPHGRRLIREPLAFTIDVKDGPAPLPESLKEEWKVGGDDVELSLRKCLRARIECARGQLRGWVTRELLESQPSIVARLLLETPAAVLLARRAYAVIHAGAVAGPSGAVVIRGAPGAGKSTLVAAAHQAGLQVLGDETVLVARDYPNELLAAVRDLTVLPDAARLLELTQVTPASTNTSGETKLRVELFPSSTPGGRRARRISTIVLGRRNGGPARLQPLAPSEFLEAFGQGSIPQENWSGTPASIADYWASHGAYRLSGSADLPGAVELLSHLIEGAPPVSSHQ